MGQTRCSTSDWGTEASGGLGDGGSGGDPQGNGQNKQSLLGKMLRIDPRGESGYTVPLDNPFVNETGTRKEIWAWGLRNPWRYSFDRETGQMWVADVGQNKYEEIDIPGEREKTMAGILAKAFIVTTRPEFAPPTLLRPSSSTTTPLEFPLREATFIEEPSFLG